MLDFRGASGRPSSPTRRHFARDRRLHFSHFPLSEVLFGTVESDARFTDRQELQVQRRETTVTTSDIG